MKEQALILIRRLYGTNCRPLGQKERGRGEWSVAVRLYAILISSLSDTH
jgi:hypothetical protein